MLDLNNCSPRDLDLVGRVLTAIRAHAPAIGGFMIVGAACRDLIHAALGHTSVLRQSNDIDLGIAIARWADYDNLVNGLGKPGDNGIRYKIAGIPVDLMPFGAIEDPIGLSTPRTRREGLSVFGFQQVYATAHTLVLEDQVEVAVPSVAGFAALKLAAWSDRSLFGEYKDALDIGTCLAWYHESPVVIDRLWGSAEGVHVLTRCDLDVERASAQLLGIDIAQTLGHRRSTELKRAWRASRLDLLPTNMLGQSPARGGDRSRAQALVLALEIGLSAEGTSAAL